MSYQTTQATKDALQAITALAEVQGALKFIEADQEQTIQNQLELVVIEAPTGQEEKKAAAMVEHFKKLGLSDCHIDEFGNAVGIRKGTGGGKKILVEGHLDTVFPMGTKIEPRREGGKIYAPGITDDTRGCVAVLSTIRALNDANIQTKGDIVFCGTAREEGMGGLGGIRDYLSAHKDIDACVCIDGPNINGIVYEATGYKTYEASFYGIGGHASGAFAKVANPLNAAARAVAKIADLQVPEDPRTIFCVSNFHAGNDAGIHAIVPQATIKYNIRSNCQEELDKLDRKIHAILAQAAFEETARWGMDTITFDYKLLAAVPAGTQCPNSPLVEMDYEIVKYLGGTPEFQRGGSTNANIPIGAGIPAVCIGMGGKDDPNHKAHTLEEFFTEKDAFKGVQLAFLLSVALTGIEGKTDSILK